MTALWPIVRLSVLEGLRRQVHLLTAFLAILVLLVPGFVNTFNLQAPERVVKDIALTLIGFYGTFIAILFGSIAVPNEIERKTIYPILARPMSRLTYLVAKFLSLFVLLTGSLLLLGVALLVATASFMRTDVRVMLPVVGYIMQCGVVGAVCLFFSTFFSPVAAAVMGLFTFMVGGLSNVFISFFLDSETSKLSALLARTLKTALPHFEFFQIKDAIVQQHDLPPQYVLIMVAYGAAWIVLLLLLAGFTFERREL